MVSEAADAVRPRLTVVAAVTPGRLETAGEELAALACRSAVAVAGAGSSPDLAEHLGVGHLAGDPVTAAREILQ
jgi:hypothetical protein